MENKPTIMITNDDGIEGPGLQSLVRLLVSTNRYHVFVCAPDTYVNFHSSAFLVSHLSVSMYYTTCSRTHKNILLMLDIYLSLDVVA